MSALVHAVLAWIDLKADAQVVEKAASVHGRIWVRLRRKCPPLSSPSAACLGIRSCVGQRAPETGACVARHRSSSLSRTGFSLRVIDLAFRDDTPDFAGWTVVDFKTDREFEETSDRYIAQVRIC